MQDFYAELNVLDRKVELFVNSFVPRGDGVVKSLVTTVTLRVPQSLDSVPTTHWVFSGSAILNPKDQFDGVHGVQVAYKRAWAEMEHMFGPFTRAEWDKLRLARWQVMEGRDRCAQDEPLELLPPETIAKLNPPLGQAIAVDLLAKYPHTADEMPNERPMCYPTVGVLLEDLTERFGWKTMVCWYAGAVGFVPKNEIVPFATDDNAPKVIRWRWVADWEAECDPEAARRAQLLAKYPHDVKVDLPKTSFGDERFDRNVGVLFADYSEGYAWRGIENWRVFAHGVIPHSRDQIGPSVELENAGVIRWRDISNWAAEKSEHDRQTV
jgi:hypothetical protein